MRRMFETAPRDGKFVILEVHANGRHKVAHWAAEAGAWVGESGEPITITPKYWYPLSGENYLQQALDLEENYLQQALDRRREARRAPQVRWKKAASSIAAVLVATAFAGVYFRADIASHVTRYASLQDILGVSTVGGQVAEQQAQRPNQAPQSQASRSQASPAAEARQSSEKEP